MSCSRSTSSVRSATSCETRESAAAPNRMRVLWWPVRPKGRSGIGMPSQHARPSVADHLTQPAGVVDGRRPALPERVVVEVAVTVETIVSPIPNAFGPRCQLAVLEEVAAFPAVEAHVGPIGGELYGQG